MTTQTAPEQKRQHWSERPEEWQELAAQPAAVREERLLRFYSDLIDLPEETRRDRIRAMTEITYRLPDAAFRALTESRLRIWLTFDNENAARVARSYDAILRTISGNAAMRRVVVVQTVMRDKTDAEQRKLRDLNPDERARDITLIKIPSFAGTARQPA